MIRLFDGSFAFLSNYYDPCPVRFENQTYRNSEAAYQASKTTDLTVREKFLNLTPDEAKKLGKQIEIRADWDKVKAFVMQKVVHAKFSQHSDLAELLLRTGDEELVEGNYWHDNYFGDCRCQTCRFIWGENVLGEILMEEREALRREQENAV